MWWKIYLVIYAGLNVLGVFTQLGKLGTLNLADYIGTAESIIIIMALYSLIFSKQIISKQTWSIIFWLILVNWFFNIAVVVWPQYIESLNFLFRSTLVPTEAPFLSTLLAIALSLPGLSAIYKLSHEVKPKK